MVCWSSGPKGNTKRRKVQNFVGIGMMEAKPLRFTEMCRARYPTKVWDDLTLKQQVDLVRVALRPGQLLLEPHSNYQKYWDLFVLLALVYTSILTPYEVAFLEGEFYGVFAVNRFVDFIFLKDMLMQFFLKVQVVEKQCSIWICDRRSIWKRYLKGWFAIDLFSILPFDTLGMMLNDPAIEKLKVVKIVRLARLLKLMRVLRASRIMKRWENSMSLSFATQGVCKFTLFLIVAAHWMACIWGLVGLLLASDLTCNEGVATIDETPNGGSWVTARSWGANSPCQPFDVYLASLHFAVMTITSIGYGDICPTRNEELITGILAQLSGGLTWAFVIGSICGIVANANPVRVDYENAMDALNAMLTEHKVSEKLRVQLREFLREQQYHDFLVRARSICSGFSPGLQGKLIMETPMGHAIQCIPYFKDCKKDFIVELAARVEPGQRGPREKVISAGCLTIIQRGSVARLGRILLPGAYWGEDLILESELLIDTRSGMSLSFVELLHLRKESLEEILSDHPEPKKMIRKAAVQIAFRSAARLIARHRRNQQNELARKTALVLIKSFHHTKSKLDGIGVNSAVFEEDQSSMTRLFHIGGSSERKEEIENQLKWLEADRIVSMLRDRKFEFSEEAGFAPRMSFDYKKSNMSSASACNSLVREDVSKCSVSKKSSLPSSFALPELDAEVSEETKKTSSTNANTVASDSATANELAEMRKDIARLTVLVETFGLARASSSESRRMSSSSRGCGSSETQRRVPAAMVASSPRQPYEPFGVGDQQAWSPNALKVEEESLLRPSVMCCSARAERDGTGPAQGTGRSGARGHVNQSE